LNVFDQFIKHKCHIKYYIRYTDDFVIVSENKAGLIELLPKIRSFLSERLLLELHSTKISIRPIQQGIDFLGYVTRPHHRTLRTRTKKRMMKKLKRLIVEVNAGNLLVSSFGCSFNSYLGVLSHAKSYRLREEIINSVFFDLNPEFLAEFLKTKRRPPKGTS
jgi:hypothetical protein